MQENQTETRHHVIKADARDLSFLPDASIGLVVTSPPYPMISMWDSQFAAQDSIIARALEEDRSLEAFDNMHSKVLFPVWQELWRVLSDGGFACINIGDAVRTIGDNFRMYPNGPRILSDLHAIGFDILPQILWRKTTNAPNKFMGSGMLPAGAYVTLEHEHILIARKGRRRFFATDEARQQRRRSAIFWEERNIWFSDVWDLRGVAQELKPNETPTVTASVEGLTEIPDLLVRTQGASKLPLRERSAAFPLELAERLILMFSVQGDTVLDPFGGTLTTTAAALASGRNSYAVEIEAELLRHGLDRIATDIPELNRRVATRLARHKVWSQEYLAKKPEGLRHKNELYGLPVMTLQETQIELPWISAISGNDDHQGGRELRAQHRIYRL